MQRGKNKEAALTVEQTVKGKTNGVTDEFQYELTSLDSGNPNAGRKQWRPVEI